jgi:formate/nitrite transporter FocA (FNT family)
MYHGSEELSVILLGFIKNLIPVAIGNMIGGMSIGALYRVAYIEKAKNQDNNN